ncbi:hypothetical protein IAD21_05769 [Abditibacteriota bacterium]|nr:hypothetical protein IAD21_05769 [Abditibacteriota bacterium]
MRSFERKEKQTSLEPWDCEPQFDGANAVAYGNKPAGLAKGLLP